MSIHDPLQSLRMCHFSGSLMGHCVCGAGASVDPLKRGDWTPLMLAAAQRDLRAAAAAQVLLQAGADQRLVNKVTALLSLV